MAGTEVSGFDAHEAPVNKKIDFMEALMDKHKVNKEVRYRVRRQYLLRGMYTHYKTLLFTPVFGSVYDM